MHAYVSTYMFSIYISRETRQYKHKRAYITLYKRTILDHCRSISFIGNNCFGSALVSVYAMSTVNLGLYIRLGLPETMKFLFTASL